VPSLSDHTYLCQAIWEILQGSTPGKRESMRHMCLEMMKAGDLHCLLGWFDSRLYHTSKPTRMCLRCSNGFQGLMSILHDKPVTEYSQRVFSMIFTLCFLPRAIVREMVTASAIAQNWWVEKAWQHVNVVMHQEGETCVISDDPVRFIRCGPPKDN
jgi:hypothetical protein